MTLRLLFVFSQPVLLISRQIIRLMAYLVMYRDEKGNWVIYCRSYASDEALEKLWWSVIVRKPKNAFPEDRNTKKKLDDVKIQIEEEKDEDKVSESKKESEKQEDEGPDDQLSFSFTGRIMNQRISEQGVIDTGSYLCLKDSQVRRMCVNRTLFEYSVEITEKE